jgi:hypothetical protein
MRVRMGIAGKSECGCGRREMNVLLKAHKEAAAERSQECGRGRHLDNDTRNR